MTQRYAVFHKDRVTTFTHAENGQHAIQRTCEQFPELDPEEWSAVAILTKDCIGRKSSGRYGVREEMQES